MKNYYLLLSAILCAMPIELSADFFSFFKRKKEEFQPQLSEAKKMYKDKKTELETKVALKLLGVAGEQYSNHEYPYSDQKAAVRQGTALAQAERDVVAQRTGFISEALSKFYGNAPVAKIRIAVAGSGGGYRAMIATCGSLAGMEASGLFDCVTYLAGVSGSTWAISGLMQSGLSPSEYVKQLLQRFGEPLQKNVNKEFLSQAMLSKVLFQQPLGFIDMYGNLVAQKIISGLQNKDNPNEFYLHETNKRVFDGTFPIPIYTSVIVAENKYAGWMEFTPFEVGSRDYLKSFVPTWAFGRRFDKGVSLDTPPPQPLSFGMGIWGSAMTANVVDILNDCKGQQSDGVQKIINQFLESSSTGFFKQRRVISPAQVANWNYGITGAVRANKKRIALADAGLAINIPMPPLLDPERDVDIIIVLDNGQETKYGDQLKRTAAYAKNHGLKFPPIDYSQTNKLVSLHQHPTDRDCPIVIYLPLVSNPDYEDGWDPSPFLEDAYTKTSNFAYTPEQVKQLSGLTSFTMQQELTKELIRQAIRIKSEIKTIA